MITEPKKKEKKSELILIIEDDKFLRELLIRKIENEGYNIKFVITGGDALRKIKEFAPQLVLLDLVLPGMSGFEILKRVKKDPEISKIPIIILSNRGDIEEVEKGLKLGADDYLIKAHFTPDEIIGKIKQVLDKRQSV